MVAQDPARLSEQIHVSLGFARLQVAYSSLKRTGYFQNSRQNSRCSLKRRVTRLSDLNDETSGSTRLEFACSSLKRTGAKQFWAGKSVARLSDGLLA